MNAKKKTKQKKSTQVAAAFEQDLLSAVEEALDQIEQCTGRYAAAHISLNPDKADITDFERDMLSAAAEAFHTIKTHPQTVPAVPTPAPADWQSTPRTLQYLTFSLHQELYAVDMRHVIEIIPYQRLTAMPMMPDYVHGIIELNDQVVPVVDLNARIGLPLQAITAKTCIIVIHCCIEDKAMQVGVVVDALLKDIQFSSEQVEAVPDFGSGVSVEFLEGVIRHDQKFIILLNIGEVLAIAALAEADPLR
jgi:purine-binding chemotaxis protein CheW